MYPNSLPEVTSSLLDLSSHEQNSLPLFTFQSTTSLDFDVLNTHQWPQKEHIPMPYETSKVILFKGVPEDLTESEILNLCEVFGTIKDIFIKKQKRYVFIQFDKVEQAQRCYESFSKIPATMRGHPLYVFHTGKDKIIKTVGLVHPPSRFVILLFNKSAFNPDKNFVFKFLAPYGRCVKIVPLQTKNLQFFVEMEDVIQAMRVKESLDGQLAFGVTEIGVQYAEEKDALQHFPSALSSSNINLSTVETLDLPTCSPKGMISNVSNLSFTNTWSEPQNQQQPCWPNMIFSKPVSNHNSHHNHHHNHNHHHHQHHAKPVSLPNNLSFARTEQYLRPTSLNMLSFQDSPFQDHPQQQQQQQQQSQHHSQPKSSPMMGSHFHTQEEKSLTILLIKNLPKGLTARILFRLFGMYGNVMKVKIFFKNPENALIEYQTAEQAELAKTYLNNCPLYGNNIFVTNSKLGVSIDTTALKRGEEVQFMGDYTNSPEHRYKFTGSKNYGNIVPPSKVLHLSNLCDDKNEMFYAQLFRDFGLIKKFTFLKGPERMALMEMGSVEETVKILSNFHNFNINGKYLKVSFSKYQKIKDL